MRTLIPIIGFAPSEIPFEELLQRISKERARVMRNLEHFAESFHTKKTPKAKVSKEEKSLTSVLQALGLSLDDYNTMRQELGEKKDD
jgi:hypothetical protein